MGCHTNLKLGFVFTVLIVLMVDLSSACQGHKLSVNYIKNCGEVKDAVIKVMDNSSIQLTDDCQVIPNSCAETIGFKKALVKYKIFKNNMVVLQGSIDACDALNKVNDDIKSYLKMFGIPTRCPFDAMKKCEDGSKKAEIQERFRKFIALARGGPIRTEIKIDHDNGHSCFKSEIEVTKKV